MFDREESSKEEKFQNVVKKFLVGQKLGKGVRACECESVRPSVRGCMCVQFFGHGQNLASNV